MNCKHARKQRRIDGERPERASSQRRAVIHQQHQLRHHTRKPGNLSMRSLVRGQVVIL